MNIDSIEVTRWIENNFFLMKSSVLTAKWIVLFIFVQTLNTNKRTHTKLLMHNHSFTESDTKHKIHTTRGLASDKKSRHTFGQILTFRRPTDSSRTHDGRWRLNARDRGPVADSLTNSTTITVVQRKKERQTHLYRRRRVFAFCDFTSSRSHTHTRSSDVTPPSKTGELDGNASAEST